MKMTESQKVAAAAWRIRRYALQMGGSAGAGLYRPRRWAMPMCSPPPSAMP